MTDTSKAKPALTGILFTRSLLTLLLNDSALLLNDPALLLNDSALLLNDSALLLNDFRLVASLPSSSLVMTDWKLQLPALARNRQLQQPARLAPFIQGSWSFPDRIAKLELGNEIKASLSQLQILIPI
jgi:hypothetical protein